jgi:TolB-like protein/Flp pilus assembly protein TadD
MDGLKRLIGEVHRRSLWQVLGIYIAGSWAALQAVDMLAESAGLPEWFPSLALGLLIIGLPVVLATAFVQEGLGREAHPPAAGEAATRASGRAAPVAPASARRLFTWRNALLGGVGAFALWGVVAAGWVMVGGSLAADSSPIDSAAPVRQSVAVLPFETRSAVAEDSFFSQGVHDDILTQLSRIEALKVISRTSVMQYAGTEKAIREIARELGVTSVLEGGVQRAGNRVRVTAQLIDAATDAHLWAANYDEALTTENIFAIQTQIAGAIAEALEARLTPAEEARIAVQPTENLEAYDLYNRARYLWEGNTEARSTALELFRRAAELDPEFAAAHAEFGSGYIWGSTRGEWPASEDGLAAARAAIARALALDPELAEAHLAHGTLLQWIEFDFEAAERANLRAVELSPGSAAGHNALAAFYLDRGRIEEARGQFRKAVALDPLALSPRANLAFVEFVSRDYAAAEAQASRVVELAPDHFVGYYMLGAALSFRGRHDEAIDAERRAVERDPASPSTRIALGFVHARAGNRDSALAIAAAVDERGGSLKEIALVHAALGDIDRAFEYLERALATQPGNLTNLDIDPSADPLRDDPRYRDILRRAGLE